MFLLPAYDPTAMAMLGFGILAVLGSPSFFSEIAQRILRHLPLANSGRRVLQVHRTLGRGRMFLA
jgi:hypothetical protein